MSLKEEVEILRSIPLFARIEPAKLKLLAFTSQRLTFAPGESLCRQGDPGDSAFIILQGSADVVVENAAGESAVVAKVGRNSVIGEIAILIDVPRTATVTATSPLQALRVDKETFFRLMVEFPQMAVEIMRELARRLDHTTRQLTAARAGRAA